MHTNEVIEGNFIQLQSERNNHSVMIDSEVWQSICLKLTVWRVTTYFVWNWLSGDWQHICLKLTVCSVTTYLSKVDCLKCDANLCLKLPIWIVTNLFVLRSTIWSVSNVFLHGQIIEKSNRPIRQDNIFFNLIYIVPKAKTTIKTSITCT